MKKIITLFFMFITLAFATPTGDLKDFTEMVSIRSLETGIFLAPLGIPQKILLIKIGILKKLF